MIDRALQTCRGAALLCSAVLVPGAAADDGAGWPVQRMLEVATITHAVPSPDGERVAYVVSEVDTRRGAGIRVAHLWVASADGSERRQFSFGDDRVVAPRWSPDGRWLAYLRRTPARPGQLMLIPSTGGGARRLTQPDMAVEAFQWSPVGDAIALLRRESPAPDSADAIDGADALGAEAGAVVVGRSTGRGHLWRLGVDGNGNPGRLERLTPDSMHVTAPLGARAFDWSPDATRLAFTHTPSAAPEDWKRADISILDLSSGRIRAFQQSNAAEFAPSYSPDGRQIAFNITMYPPSAMGQWRVGSARTDGSGLKLLAATPDQQPRIVGWITDRTVLVSEPHRTVTALWTLPADGREPRRFDRADAALSALTLNEPATRLAFATTDERTLPEAAVTTLRRFRPTLVSTANQGHEGAPPTATEVVSWPSRDNLEIEGLLTLPEAGRDRAHPLVVLIHDAPAGVFTRSDPRHPSGIFPVATLASRGYAVLRANPRGAGGYGHAFRAGGGESWNGAAYDDLMSGVDHLIETGVADGERLAVMGWGHGGYLAAMMVARSHRFGAAVLGAPMTDLVQMRLAGEGGSFLVDYLGAEYWEREDVYRTLSPLYQAHQITTPALILHGGADLRIPPGQGLALHRALQVQGLETRMVLYPGAAHRIREPAQQLHAAREVLTWLARYVDAP